MHFFGPHDGFVYNGKVTFTSSKGVDIYAYHDITGQSVDTAGLSIWQVGGKTHTLTKLMTNVTSGTVDLVESGLLAHSRASDPYTVTFSADGPARKVRPIS